MGITNKLSFCASPGYPSVFTRLTYYQNWINTIISSPDNNVVPPPSTTYKCDKKPAVCGCGYSNVEFPAARIVGGEEAVPYSWSMLVSIRFGNTVRHSCSGTILDPSHILTAAHCVDEESPTEPDQVSIAAGMHNRSEDSQTTRLVDRIYIHPNWNVSFSGYLYDIAILHLTIPYAFDRDPFVSTTCIPGFKLSTIVSQYPTNSTELVVIGWGSTRLDSDSLMDTLRQAKVRVIDNEDTTCKSLIRDKEKQFCAGLNEGGKGSIITMDYNFIDSSFLFRPLPRYV